jgi:hypothetical protein
MITLIELVRRWLSLVTTQSGWLHKVQLFIINNDVQVLASQIKK